MGRRKTTQRVRVCPICGSTRLRRESPFSGWLTPEVWVCPDCGYRGPIYGEIEVEVEDGETREERERKEGEDLS